MLRQFELQVKVQALEGLNALLMSSQTTCTALQKKYDDLSRQAETALESVPRLRGTIAEQTRMMEKYEEEIVYLGDCIVRQS